MRFIKVLSDSEQRELCHYVCKKDLLVRERKRFTMISLSSFHKMSIHEISESCEVSTSTVQNVFNRFEQGGFEALLDRNMSHKQSSLAVYEEELILDAVRKNPQSLQQVLAYLSEQGIDTNKSILKRYLKKKALLGEESANL